MMNCVLLGTLSIHPLGTINISPGFYNVQCYKILAGWQGGVRSEEQVAKEESEVNTEENKKRRIDCADTEDGVHSELQRTHTEGMSEFQISRELPLSTS